MTPVRVSDRARETHRRAIVIDGHMDTIIKNLEKGRPANFGERREDMDVDLPRMREGGVTAGFVMCGGSDLAQSLRLIDRVYEEARLNSEDLLVALRAEDVRRAKEEDKAALIMELEGASLFGDELGVLRSLHRLGVRMVGPTHGEGGGPHDLQLEPSLFAYCDARKRESLRKTQKGLTDFAKELLAEMNRLGVLLDLAHINDAAFFEALELIETPPLFSHGCCFALCPHSRNLTDDQLRALAARGGVAGMAFFVNFVDQHAASLERLVDHFAYAADLVGVEHVGVGSDFDGCRATVIPDVSHLPALTEALLARGFSEAETEQMLGGNMLRALEAAVG